MFLTFKKWVKNIQTTGYNGARTVFKASSKFSVPFESGEPNKQKGEY